MNPDIPVVMAYDNLSSPPTYGDFIDHVMLARYLKVRGHDVRYFVVNDGHKKSWHQLGEDGRNTLLRDQISISKCILGLSEESDFVITHDQLTETIESDVEQITPFSQDLINRNPTYKKNMTLLSMLYDKQPLKEMRITRAFDGYVSPIREKYIAWHVRSGFTGARKKYNLAESQFRYELENLRKLTKVKILILTSRAGYESLKSSVDLDLNTEFSKQNYSSFLEDASLAANASLYLQFGHGGLFTIPVNSETPYYLTRKSYFDKRDGLLDSLKCGPQYQKLKPWSSENQVIDDSDDPDWGKIDSIIQRLGLK